jgi:hypothetical protein
MNNINYEKWIEFLVKIYEDHGVISKVATKMSFPKQVGDKND